MSLSVVLLGLGGYLLYEQFEDPVEANPAALIVAALLIATAASVLHSLLYHSLKARLRVLSDRTESISSQNVPGNVAGNARNSSIVLAHFRLSPWREHSDLHHSRYVDRARIRP
jgi:hypothetical protein